MSEESEYSNRRQFIKSVGAFTIAGGLSAKGESSSISADKGYEIPAGVDYSIKEYHICQGLNMKEIVNADNTVIKAGMATESNLPVTELHSCEGGNSCAGLGACGTGGYARQYWIADNQCGKQATEPNQASVPWNGTGGCGVPIGTGNTGYVSSQLNSAAPGANADGKEYPSDFVGQPVWNIARARFEAKMVKNKKPFGVPSSLSDESDLYAASWDGTSTYKPHTGSPPPYPTPLPVREKPQPKLSE